MKQYQIIDERGNYSYICENCVKEAERTGENDTWQAIQEYTGDGIKICDRCNIDTSNKLTKSETGYTNVDGTIKLVFDAQESDNNRNWYDVYINGKRVGSAPCDTGYDYTGQNFDDLMFYNLNGDECNADGLNFK